MIKISFLLIFGLTVCIFTTSALSASSNSHRKTVSVVTGANGYIAREVVHTLLSSKTQDLLNDYHKQKCVDHDVLCLVRPSRVQEETEYWESYKRTIKSDAKLKVLPYDMLDQGESLSSAIDDATTDLDQDPSIVLYHVASKFGPTENHTETAIENVAGTDSTVRTLAKYPNSRLILTSSMAAVRGTGQTPLHHPSYYTHQDWNTMSKLGANWGSSYQWSKCNSERRAWELSKELGVQMTTLCPSFVFGPFPTQSGTASQSFSIQLVSQWIKGESAVQSRLCVDIRDVALAHVKATYAPNTIGQRYIISSEARLTSKQIAEVLKDVCKSNLDLGMGNGESIYCDEKFDGGAIKIGEKEVDAAKRMEDDLGVTCRDVKETMADMGKSLLQSMQSKQ